MNLQVVGMGCDLITIIANFSFNGATLPWHILFVASTVQKLHLQFMFIDSLFIPKLSKKKQLNLWKIGSFQHDFCMYQVYTQQLETNFFPTTWPLKTSRNLLVTVKISNHLKLWKPTQNCFHGFNPETKGSVNQWRFQLTSWVFPFFPFRLQGPTPLHTTLAIFTSHQIEDRSNCPSPKWILVEKIWRPRSKSRYRWTQMYLLMMFAWCFLMIFWCVTLDVFAEILSEIDAFVWQKAPHKSCKILQFLFINLRTRWTNLRTNFLWTSVCGFSCWSLERQTHNPRKALRSREKPEVAQWIDDSFQPSCWPYL